LLLCGQGGNSQRFVQFNVQFAIKQYAYQAKRGAAQRKGVFVSRRF